MHTWTYSVQDAQSVVLYYRLLLFARTRFPAPSLEGHTMTSENTFHAVEGSKPTSIAVIHYSLLDPPSLPKFEQETAATVSPVSLAVTRVVLSPAALAGELDAAVVRAEQCRVVRQPSRPTASSAIPRPRGRAGSRLPVRARLALLLAQEQQREVD